MQIICIGSSSKDIFFPTGDGVVIDTPENLESQKKLAFEMGAKYQVEDRFESLGGCAANVSVGLARLGIEVSLATKVGDDDMASWIRKNMEKEGVDIKIMQSENNCQTDLSAIIVDKNSGDRVIFFNRDANEKLEIKAEDLKNSDWFFISALNSSSKNSWMDNLEKILNIARKNKTRIAFNPGQKNIKENAGKIIEAIKAAKILMVNKDEALEIVMNLENKESDKLNEESYLLKTLKDLGPDVVTLTDGARGAWAYDGKESVRAEALEINPQDTTGSGDAFSSAFLGAYFKNKKIAECLKWGIANGGSVAGFYGAIGGLLREDEISKRVNEIKINKL